MSGYVRAVGFEIEFDGQKVTGTFDQLSLQDYLSLKSKDVETDDDAAKTVAAMLPRYTKNLNGLTASDGSPVPIEEVCSKVYFVKLVNALGEKLITSAIPPQKPSETSAS